MLRKNWGVSGLDPEFRPISSRELYDDLLTMQSGQQEIIWQDGRHGQAATRTPDTISRRIEILLDKDPRGEGFGFVLRGGALGSDAALPPPLTVTKIIPGSPADREGTLQVGDRILEIDGADMSQFTVQQAANILNEAENDVTLLVEYDVVVLEWIANATGPVVVEIEKPAGKTLDITLSSTVWNGVEVIYIDSVYEAGIADRNGSLHVGDHVCSIDGLCVEGRSVAQVSSILKSNVTDRIQLEIFPTNAQLIRETHIVSSSSSSNMADDSHDVPLYDNFRPQDNNRVDPKEDAMVASSDEYRDIVYNHHHHHPNHHPSSSNRGVFRHHPPPPPPPSYSTLNLSSARAFDPSTPPPPRSLTPPHNFHHQTRRINGTAANGLPHPTPLLRSLTPSASGGRNAATPFRAKRVISSSSGGLARGGFPGGAVGGGSPVRGSTGSVRRLQKTTLNQAETTELVLYAKENGVGMEIETLATDEDSACAVVTHLEPSGVADRCGLLQEGDRIIAINGQSTKGKTTEDIRQLIAVSSPGLIRILFEFNVADSIVVNSGTIVAKLVKSGSNLGLTFACPENRKTGDPLIISEIRKGSVSHRIGALCVGDALLSIDDNDVTNSSVDHVTRLLLDSCTEVVQLTVRKKEFNTGPATTALNFVTFSVELPLHSGGSLLGVSLSQERKTSSDANSIIITDIAEGSIAQLTSALRIGDEILSVNGRVLDTMNLDEVQDLLANSLGSICLKIKRYTQKVRGSERTEQKTQNSVDSAVESCDSSFTPNGESTVTICVPSSTQPTSASSALSSSSSSFTHRNLIQCRQPQPAQVCNEVRIQAEIHHSPDHPPTTRPPAAATDRLPLPVTSFPLPVTSFPLPVTSFPVISTSGSSTVEEDDDDEDEWSCKVDELDKLPPSSSCAASGGSTELLGGSSIAYLDSFHASCSPSLRSVTSQSRSVSGDVRRVTSQSQSVSGDVRRVTSQSQSVSGDVRRVTSQSQSVSSDVRRVTSENAFENNDDDVRINEDEGKTEGVATIKADSVTSDESLPIDIFKEKLPERTENPGSLTADGCHRRTKGQKQAIHEEGSGPGPGPLGPFPDPAAEDSAGGRARELHQLEELLESIFTPTPVELLRVVLYKLRSCDDFGFSLSDGVYEKGVYVSGVKHDGPASEGLLPFDKILQVNKVKTKDLDCHQVVPLIAQSGNCVELIVCRNALTSSSLPQTEGNSSSSDSPAPLSSSECGQDPPSDQMLWKPRCKRKVNFFPKNSVF